MGYSKRKKKNPNVKKKHERNNVLKISATNDPVEMRPICFFFLCSFIQIQGFGTDDLTKRQ